MEHATGATVTTIHVHPTNGEPGLELVFGDAGQVFNRKSDFAIRDMESDVGFGFRFNQRDKTFLRLDVGFSHEGFQIWVKFANVFKKGPVHTSSNMGDF